MYYECKYRSLFYIKQIIIELFSILFMRKIERFDKYMEYKELNDNKVTVQLGLSVGTLGKSRKYGRDLSDKVIEQILNFYTDLNRIWLLTGEGEMIKDKITQEANGDNNMQVAGNSNNINNSAAIKLALSEISEMRKLLQEQVKNNQDQFNRFMSVIERLTNN